MLLNWVAAFEPLARKGWYWDAKTGKFRLTMYAQPHDTPWLHAPVLIPGTKEIGMDCGTLTLFHNNVMNRQSVHSFCFNCYKVVIMPTTLEQVHKIADWQQSECTENGWPCKVGAERRNYVQRKWGAYFYCRGVEEGKERYKAVRKWVDENLGKDVKVILKRGCTEFEQHLGDSSKWKLLPNQEKVEEEWGEVVDYEPMGAGQAPSIQHHVYDVWDAWDKDNMAPVTYHDHEEGE